jgi:hypothetical protein
MKKAFLAFAMVLMASPASAGGLVTKHASSVQLTVDAARTTATRMGNSYSVSGSGVVTDIGGGASPDLNVGGLGTLSSGVAGGSIPTATQATSGNSFSFSNSFTAGDATLTTAPTVGDVSAFSSQTSYTAGTAGSLAGTVSTAGAVTVTAGGAGSSAVGQYVSEITVID